MSKERRLFQRLPFQAQAQLVFAAQVQNVQVLDISLKGALVQPLEPLVLPKQAPCQLILELAPGCHIAMSADVAHCQEQLLGLYCTGIDLDSITHLRRLLELHTGDSSMVEREFGLLGIA